MPAIVSVSTRERSFAVAANRAVYWLSRHWLLVVNVASGVYVGLPWLAPVFVHLGWTGAANIIYLIYSTQCHQLPQRSYFLFGEQLSYSLAEIQAIWQDTNNPLVLRQFIGNADMGWKVAWSDRMVSMYTGIFFGGLIFSVLRKWMRPLRWWGFGLLILPMVIDGGTHLVSDVFGIGKGFRDSNTWLAALTGNVFPATFYAGDVLGSFNSWMRLMTGGLFALGCVWFAYPHLETAFADVRRDIEAKFQPAALRL
ncbi:MAG: DUF2085 domain-containing protein [Anaerolineales bacterium]